MCEKVKKKKRKKLKIKVDIETGAEPVAENVSKTLQTFTCGDANIFTE